MADSGDISIENQRNLQRKFFFGVCLGIIIFLSVNVVQIFVEYTTNFGGDVRYGFPYPVYEYWGMMSRGRYRWGMLLPNIIIAVTFSILLGYALLTYQKYFGYIPPSIIDSNTNGN